MRNLKSLNEKHLRAGMRRWRKWDSFPKDFHNSFYRQQEDCLASRGISEPWWKSQVDVLFAWKALRPLGKEVMTRRGLERLPRIRREHDRLLHRNRSLADAEWCHLEPLFEVAREIKGVESPVFASKLCHFLVPNGYVVIDRAAIKSTTNDYVEYWRTCRDLWRDCDSKSFLKKRLRSEIVKVSQKERVFSGYPWAVKITEICLIGAQSKPT